MKKFLLLITLCTISSAYAIRDQDSVLKMPQTGLKNIDQPAVEFTLVNDLNFSAGSYESNLSESSSIGQCSLILSVIDDHSNERVMRAGKKMKLALAQYVNNAQTSGYIFYVSFLKADGKRDFVSISCAVPVEEFKNYSYGQLKSDLKDYFKLSAQVPIEL